MDLNADVGESFGRWELGDDAGVLAQVSSANVACGFHAGDPRTLVRTCGLAVAAGVTAGAQVSYRDLAGFGRRFIDIEPEELAADVVYQMGALDGILRTLGGRISYVKPHGALYHAVVDHEEQAAAVIRAVRSYDDRLPVLGLPGSALLEQAGRSGLRAVEEAFADRAYTRDGTLVSRREEGAVLDDPGQVAARVVSMVTRGEVEAHDGSVVPLAPESVCLHGDTPDAVAMATRVREALLEAGVEVRAFA